MPVITLTTDFGTKDAYVGIMKGVILRIDPSAVIVDITHAIDPQDLIFTAYTIYSAYRYFPEHSVHVIVVDPGVGSNRHILAVKKGAHHFIAPDNGVLTLIAQSEDIEEIVLVENSSFFLEPISRTFHGRDIFAPVAAHLAGGVSIKDLGPPLDRKYLTRLCLPELRSDDKGKITGTVIGIDRFGNLITNIDGHLINRYRPDTEARALTFRFGKFVVKGLSPCYQDTAKGEPLVIVGSMGYIEIAINCGNAKQELGLDKGDSVEVSIE